VEFVIRVKSGSPKRSRENPAETHIFGPSGASREDVIDALFSYSVEQPPEMGFTYPAAIDWGGKTHDADDETLRERIGNLLQNPKVEWEEIKKAKK